MNAIGALLAIYCTYLAYQWGAGHRKQPSGIVIFLVMALCVLTTIPAYYIGKHNKETR